MTDSFHLNQQLLCDPYPFYRIFYTMQKLEVFLSVVDLYLNIGLYIIKNFTPKEINSQRCYQIW